MKTIEIMMKKTAFLTKKYEVPESVYEEIKRTQRIPEDYFSDMEETIDDCEADAEYDYSVYDFDTDETLVYWEVEI